MLNTHLNNLNFKTVTQKRLKSILVIISQLTAQQKDILIDLKTWWTYSVTELKYFEANDQMFVEFSFGKFTRYCSLVKNIDITFNKKCMASKKKDFSVLSSMAFNL